MKKRNKYIFTLICLLSFTFINCHAQISKGGFPLSDKLEGSSLRYALTNEWEEMPEFSLDLLEKDSSSFKIGGVRFAYGFNVNLTPNNSGTITYLANGTKVWRVKIHSENALNLNLIFDKFHLEEGAKLFLYTPDKRQILGAFTSDNNHRSNILATSVIEGDRVIVEYIEPKGCSGEISIGRVNHGFKDLRKLPYFGSSEGCEVDVNCTNDLAETAKRSTALVTINGETLCSGSLINNTANDKTPYLLSAAHCVAFVNGYSSNQMAATCVFYFNYETPHCFDKIQGTLEMSLSGATIATIQENTDLLLLQLDEIPPIDYNTYYSGWNIAESIQGKVYAVHHPEGDVKKVSRSLTHPTPSDFDCCDEPVVFSSNSHWEVAGWEYGITEGGSSGAPLFDKDDQIIGALSGGYEPSGCEEDNHDFFYRINKVWNGRIYQKALSTWLDPLQTGLKAFSGLEPYQYPCSRISNYDSNDELHHSNETDYPAGSNENGILEYAERFNTNGVVFGVHFILEKGTFYEKDTIWMKIYTGDKKPDSLIYQQRVRISDSYYDQRKGYFQETTQSNLMSKDNYLRLDSVVKVDSSFFIAFEISPNLKYPFAIYATEKKASGQNTAYFKTNGEWKDFTSHPYYSRPTSLLIEPRIASQLETGVSTIFANERAIEIYPNPTTDEVTIEIGEGALNLTIYNMEGINWLSKSNPTEKEVLNLSKFPAGNYIVKITYPNKTSYAKIIKL